MIEEKQIKKWLEQGVIDQQQAEYMLKDIVQEKKERSSNRFIVAISTIGALLLGIGVILFIASNWDEIPKFVKIFLLVASTYSSFYGGFWLKYQRANFPKVGAALIFLSSLLFGATLALIGQIYHSQANSHWIILLWMVGIVPLIYIFESAPSAGLINVLFLVWIGFFFFENDNLDEEVFPTIYLSAGVLLFNLGNLIKNFIGFPKISRIFKLFGLDISLVILFLLTFHDLTEEFGGNNLFADNDFLTKAVGGIVLLFLISAILAISSLILDKQPAPQKYLEGGFSLVLLAAVFLFQTFSSQELGILFAIIFNVIFSGLIILLLYEGYKREDMKLINLSLFWLEIFVIARYFDLFWDLLSQSAFFIIGGLILIVASVFLERKRKQLKMQFNSQANLNYEQRITQ